MKTLLPWWIALLLAPLPAGAEGTATFTILEALPGTVFSSAVDVSGDGSVVVGWASNFDDHTEAVRWEGSEPIGLGDLAGGALDSGATAVSADGSVIAGYGTGERGREAVRWIGGEPQGLGDVPGGDFDSVAEGISADGSVVVGWGLTGTTCCPFGSPVTEAFRWEGGVLTPLGDLPGRPPIPPRAPDFGSDAVDVSADGSIVVGTGVSELGFEAYRWENGIMTGLGVPPGSRLTTAAAASNDASVLVGNVDTERATSVEAARFADGAIQPLGDLPGDLFISAAFGVSGDGSVVVGRGRTENLGEAFIWDETNGMRNLKDVLQDEFGLDLSDWRLEHAAAISQDGRTIVGRAIGADGGRGFVVRFSGPPIEVTLDVRPWHEPNVIDLRGRPYVPVAILGSESFDVTEVDTRTLAFGPDGAMARFAFVFDVDRDGWRDLFSIHRTRETGIGPGDVEACIAASTFDGTPVVGCDAIVVVDPRDRWLAFLRALFGRR